MDDRIGRRKLAFRHELLLALAPTFTVLLVLWMIEVMSTQRLLFSSLASSAFLIYLDPAHPVNRGRTLLVSQPTAAVLGVAGVLLFGPGYAAAGTAMVAAIVIMIATDTVHPPAVSTALGFGLKTGDASNLALFIIALAITVLLFALQRITISLLRRMHA